MFRIQNIDVRIKDKNKNNNYVSEDVGIYFSQLGLGISADEWSLSL